MSDIFYLFPEAMSDEDKRKIAELIGAFCAIHSDGYVDGCEKCEEEIKYCFENDQLRTLILDQW